MKGKKKRRNKTFMNIKMSKYWITAAKKNISKLLVLLLKFAEKILAKRLCFEENVVIVSKINCL